MSTLPPCPVLAWSALSPLGRACSGVALASGSDGYGFGSLTAGLEEHSSLFGIPGRSGFVRTKLAPLPAELARHESRAARLLLGALLPILPRIHEARARYGAERVAVILGSSTGGIDATEEALGVRRSSGVLPSSYDFEAAHSYDGLLRVARATLDVRGPAFVVSTACSSAGKAIAVAQRLLAAGVADVVLTGGVDSLCELTVRGFAGLSILAPDGCRPFGANRTGISIGEGAALLLLGRASETAKFALLSAGESNDAYHPTAPHPEGVGAELALRRALALSSRKPEDVLYVNAHGTGTEHNDAAEALALARVFDGRVAFSSTKDRSGHLLGAAGALEAVLCLEGLRRGEFPENGSRPHDERLAVRPLEEPLRKSPLPGGVVLSNSFAFGGNNVTLAFGLHEPTNPTASRGAERVFVRAAALRGSGYGHLEDLVRTSPGGDPRTTPPEILPPRVRGRASPLTRLFADLFGELVAGASDAKAAPLFTGSAFGEMPVTLELLAQLGVDPVLSPARFQASVHNSAAGLLTQHTENRSFSTAIAAGAETFGMTLLDAYAWLRVHGGTANVLVGDTDPPVELLGGARPPNLGVGLFLCAAKEPPVGSLAEILALGRGDGVFEGSAEDAPLRDSLHAAAVPWFRDLARHVLGIPGGSERRTYALGAGFELRAAFLETTSRPRTGL